MKNTKKLYELIKVDSDKFDEFYDDCSLTFVGCTTDKDNIDYLYNWLKDVGVLKEGTLPIYTYTGKLMNEKYELIGDNKYHDDVNFITIMLSDIFCNNDLIFKRFELGGRWFSDIVDNNMIRQEAI